MNSYTKYLADLNLSPPMRERINLVVKECSNLCRDKILDVFVCNEVETDRATPWGSLWMFTVDGALEARNFLTEDNYDYILLSGGISYLKWTKRDFDLQSAGESSRFSVEFTLGMSAFGTGGNLVAAGKNCLQLHALAERYLLPRAKKS